MKHKQPFFKKNTGGPPLTRFSLPWIPLPGFLAYRISSYSFRGNYSFLNLEIQRSHYIRPKVTVHKCLETIQGRKLYEEIHYVRATGGFSCE